LFGQECRDARIQHHGVEALEIRSPCAERLDGGLRLGFDLGERGGAGRGDDFGGGKTREVLDGFFAEAEISDRYYDGFAREVGGRDGRFEG